MKTIEVHEGIHFVDMCRLRRKPETGNLKLERTEFLKFARRGKACPVFGLDSLAGRLRAGRFFKARLACLPVSAAAVRRSWLLPLSGALSPFSARAMTALRAVNPMARETWISLAPKRVWSLRGQTQKHVQSDSPERRAFFPAMEPGTGRRSMVPESIGLRRSGLFWRAWIRAFFGRIGRIGRMVWKSEIVVSVAAVVILWVLLVTLFVGTAIFLASTFPC